MINSNDNIKSPNYKNVFLHLFSSRIYNVFSFFKFLIYTSQKLKKLRLFRFLLIAAFFCWNGLFHLQLKEIEDKILEVLSSSEVCYDLLPHVFTEF